jgi:hypothetical protein
MAQLVLLLPADRDEVSLGPKNVEALARLGVTSVLLARDERTAAVILEGWALDPGCHDEALAALGASMDTSRALAPVVHMVVSGAPTQTGGNSR